MSNKDAVKKHAKRAVNVGLGVVQLVGDQLEKVISGLEKDGHIDRKSGKRMAQDLLGDVNKFQRKISARVDKQVRKVVKSSGTSKPKKKARRSRKK